MREKYEEAVVGQYLEGKITSEEKEMYLEAAEIFAKPYPFFKEIYDLAIENSSEYPNLFKKVLDISRKNKKTDKDKIYEQLVADCKNELGIK